MEFLEKLMALVPRPRINLIRFHGILAPHAQLRAMVVPKPPEIAAIEDPRVIEKILSHIGLPIKPPKLMPARWPPQEAWEF